MYTTLSPRNINLTLLFDFQFFNFTIHLSPLITTRPSPQSTQGAESKANTAHKSETKRGEKCSRRRPQDRGRFFFSLFGRFSLIREQERPLDESRIFLLQTASEVLGIYEYLTIFKSISPSNSVTNLLRFLLRQSCKDK